MKIKRKVCLTSLLMILLLVSWSSSAFAAVSLAVTPSYNFATPQTNYWCQWDTVFTGDSGKWYCIELWHDSTKVQTFWNCSGNGWMATIDDYWGGASSGVHNAYFKVYRQTAYQTLTKASGVLLTVTRSVEVD